MNKVLFREEQQFREWWQIVLILAGTIPALMVSIYTLYQQAVKGIRVGDSPAPNAVLVFVIIALCVSVWVYFSLKLEVWIDHDGVHYRFFPIIFKNKIISRAEIQRFEIRKYRAKMEYGGRGIRLGFGRKWGKAFTIVGDTGLQLYLTNGKKVLYGTQRSQAISYAMEEMMKSKM